MSEYRIPSRELNQDVGRVKRAAAEGPVIITDRGKPAYVLLNYADYRRRLIPEKEATLVDLIGEYGPEHDFDFEPPRLSDNMGLKIPDFDD